MNASSRLIYYAVVDSESYWLFDEQEKCCETVSSTSVKLSMFNMMFESTDSYLLPFLLRYFYTVL